MKQLLIKYILPYLAYLLLQVWCRTLRVSNLSPENEEFFENLPGRYIMTHWHSRIFFLLFYFRGRKDWNILVSPSEDAEVLARLGVLLGYTVVRGSSFKNTQAASKQLLKALKRDERVVVVADGSRGPRHVAQMGSIQLARITGAPLIPMTFGASPRHEFNSWDRFVLPLPFSKCTLNFAKPITLPKKADGEMMAERMKDLDKSLNTITQAVD